MRHFTSSLFAFSLALAGCSSSTTPGGDSGPGGIDAPIAALDAGPEDDAGPRPDAPGADAPIPGGDAGSCAAMDARMGRVCGPTERPGPRWRWNGVSCEVVYWCECLGADCAQLYSDEASCDASYDACLVRCTNDSMCPAGTSWCERGRCRPCDNGGLLCDIACSDGWSTYERNGCHPCECAPPNACRSDAECGPGNECYAGAFCWDWCPPDDPTCCFGNVCSTAGCAPPPPTGCRVRGCPMGQTCGTSSAGACAPSSCVCGSSGWGCTRDCGGGTCTTGP
jgi:hypothetical protein